MMSRTVGWLTLFLIGTDLFVMSPLLPMIGRSLGIGAVAGGWLVTVFALGYLIGGPSLGAVADRRGRYTVLTGALAVFVVANLATALAPSLAVLLAARTIAGVAASGITPSVYALVSATAPRSARGSWLAVVTSGLLIALIIGAPAGALLAVVLGWHGVFFVITAAALVILAVTGYSSVRARAQQARAIAVGFPSSTADATETAEVAAPPSIMVRIRAVCVTALWALAVYGFYTYLATVLIGFRGFSTDLVAWALACFGGGAVLGNLLGGRLADRYGGKLTSMVSLLALAVAQAAFSAVLYTDSIVVLDVFAVAIALAAYPYFSAQQLRLMARYPEASGSLLAWNNSAMYLGILLGSALGGVALTVLGPQALAAAAAAVAAVGAFATTWSIPAKTWTGSAPTPELPSSKS
ncbi:MFS transporter [Pseudonocardia spinosispora]|uniref:MFS transporter n=1 Tax=Pseudonocardia spinosispora TaxID=103441 RepID=UPI000687FF03|nr:MFS transporter [Pseudonocardia spinosispora]